jgi:hypothetical protein
MADIPRLDTKGVTTFKSYPDPLGFSTYLHPIDCFDYMSYFTFYIKKMLATRMKDKNILAANKAFF